MILQLPGLEIYPDRRKIYRDCREIRLTAKEFDILCYLAVNQGRVMTYGQIYEQVVCLNDYKNYSKFTYDFLNVTDEVIRCYDRGSHSIKEFRLK